jgi:hypothetical protein
MTLSYYIQVVLVPVFDLIFALKKNSQFLLKIYFSLWWYGYNNTNQVEFKSAWSVRWFHMITDLPQVTDKLYHIICIKHTLPRAGFELTTLEVIGTDWIYCCKSNYNMITTTVATDTVFQWMFTLMCKFVFTEVGIVMSLFRWYHTITTMTALVVSDRWFNIDTIQSRPWQLYLIGGSI